MRKKITVLILFLLFLIGACLYINRGIQTTAKSGNFFVSDGESTREVFGNLAKEGYLNDGNLSFYYSRFLYPASFKSGEYELDGSLTLPALIDYLSDSSNAVVKDVSITFQEGNWLKEFASKIANATNLEEKQLLSYWDDKDVVRSYMAKYPFLGEEILNENIRHPLEGYFFPDTYTFYKETSVEEVTKKLLDNTEVVYESLKSEIAKSDLSLHQLFTLASIIQYESANVADMKNVASVFFNRLQIGMKLQSSVTVCYALNLEKSDSWTACEYNPDYDSPYNTYLHEGLPPGPILNPGKDALLAALNPNETEYYYFMANVCGDGQVYYSKTLAEHEAYVQELLTCY